ncbi:hypothetical protein NP493_683g02001 [Ridgeia piscesae]|uniref:Uncharacterized protein n=1 Tax=Ridgeia piscesae TaxID=27915 RepID=A0AAD9KR12_RIDPI|nr:hypothetical protein NP493_683g02001 [Ridgeia piscesae]
MMTLGRYYEQNYTVVLVKCSHIKACSSVYESWK